MSKTLVKVTFHNTKYSLLNQIALTSLLLHTIVIVIIGLLSCVFLKINITKKTMRVKALSSIYCNSYIITETFRLKLIFYFYAMLLVSH